MSLAPQTTPAPNLRSILSAVLVAGVAATCTMLANAQSEAPEAAEVSETTTLGVPLGETAVSTTVAPLTSSFQPSTPWPAPATISPTTTLEAPPHNLLAYSGVEAAVRKLIGDSFPTWQSQLESETTQQTLPSGLLVSGGCLKPCDMHKSLLVVNPTNYRVYVAMVAQGKVSMWPSLMSWPDESIPTLKTWLADATDDSEKK